MLSACCLTLGVPSWAILRRFALVARTGEVVTALHVMLGSSLRVWEGVAVPCRGVRVANVGVAGMAEGVGLSSNGPLSLPPKSEKSQLNMLLPYTQGFFAHQPPPTVAPDGGEGCQPHWWGI